jgi:microcystin-dependent protein
MESFIGQICYFPWNWTPRGWARCNGQFLAVSKYMALYSLIGIEFGGDGRTTFALPKIDPIATAKSGNIYAYICLDGIFPGRS